MSFEARIGNALGARREWARDVLRRLIGFRSVTGTEGAVQEHLRGRLVASGFDAELVGIPADIAADRDFTDLPGLPGYDGRPNLVVSVPGTGGGRSVLLNTHTDVVPGPDELFSARIENGAVIGRGACDAKGQVVTVLLALTALQDLKLSLRGNVQAYFVVGEEAGGNGTLAALLGGARADAAVVLEPTGLVPRTANRGAVWFRLAVAGRSVHMGRAREGVNAVEEAMGLLPILKDYEAFLRAESKGQPGFPDEPSPVVVNVGRILGGDWPSTVPAECVLEGGIAFLPNRTIAEVMAEFRAFIDGKAGPWAKAHYSLAPGGLHNEAFVTPPDHPAVAAFRRAAGLAGAPQGPEGWDASCDARLLFHRGGMPTLVYGAGDLGDAHSPAERVRLDDVLAAARTLVLFLVNWCGAEGQEDDHAR